MVAEMLKELGRSCTSLCRDNDSKRVWDLGNVLTSMLWVLGFRVLNFRFLRVSGLRWLAVTALSL